MPTQHPLAGMWLTHRSMSGIGMSGIGVKHFSSIMSLEDREIAASIAHMAGKRFDGDYLTERERIETWLKAAARKNGVLVNVDPPLYFRLYPQPLRTIDDDHVLFNVPVVLVSPHVVTFTFEDSFHNFAALQGRPVPSELGDLTPRVYTAMEIAELLSEDGFPDYLDGRHRTRYIEAQVWDAKAPAITLLRQMSAQSMVSGVLTVESRGI